MRTHTILLTLLIVLAAPRTHAQDVTAALDRVTASQVSEAYASACALAQRVRTAMNERQPLHLNVVNNGWPARQAELTQAYADALARSASLELNCLDRVALSLSGLTALEDALLQLNAVVESIAAGDTGAGIAAFDLALPVRSDDLAALAALIEDLGGGARGPLRLAGAGGALLPPGFGVVESTVAWTAGVGVLMSNDLETEVAVGSNLLGYLVENAGSAIFGDGAFFDYVKDHLVVGVGLPLRGDGGISTQFGLALGEIGFTERLTFWPALSLVALDAADVRLPSAITDGTDGQTYTRPTLSLAFIPFPSDQVARRIRARKPVFAITLAVGFPYYREGGLIEGLGALFTAPGDFERAGNPAVSVSVSIPFVRLVRDQGGGS
ncbi:MAG: hypothetical protein AAF624_08735 [Bacteroidota bacterium]